MRLVLAIILAMIGFSVAAQSCRVAVRDERTYDLLDAGEYCLNEDYSAPSLFDWHAMRKGGYEGLVYMFKSGTTLDFKGHAITIGSGANFIIGGHASHHDPKPIDLTVKNGKIEGPATYGGFLGTQWAPLMYRFSALSLLSDMDPKWLNNNKVIPIVGNGKTYGESFREDFFELRKQVPLASRFPHGGYVLENMTIRLTHSEESIGALLAGADNIVRHCTIEVDGAIGLYLIGPRALVEDNTIIIRGEAAPVREANAAIKLDRADGSIIRNNRIVIKNGAAKPAQVVSLIESENITLENNVIYGDVPTTVKAFDEQSQWTEKGTQRKSMTRWWFE